MIEANIEAIEGQYVDGTDEEVQDLLIKEEDVRAELDEEIQGLAELSGNNNTIIEPIVGDIMIDPTLTMDLTTMNPPDSNAMEEVKPSNEHTGLAAALLGDEAAGTTKEAESAPSVMDTGPDRNNITATTSVAVLAGEAKEVESEAENIDTELDRNDNNATTGPINETDVISSTAGANDETGTGVENEGETKDNIGDGVGGDLGTLSSSPTPKVTALANESSPPTVVSLPDENVPLVAPTAPPTVVYVEPVDESLDPVANEQGEDFEDGEVIQSGGNDGSSEDGSSSPSGTTTDDIYREEEEVKKVGGWLSVMSIILMIYTAYQMSENPDGICASLCRLVITVIGCMIKIALIPCKFIMGGGRPSGGHYMATPDYRDPYGSRHLELT